MILSHKIHVLTRKEELDTVRLHGKVAVVLDVLFATSTMVAALAHGATDVVPVRGEAAAREAALRCAPGSCVLSGELDAVTLGGFAPPTPLALIDYGFSGRRLIYSTTNGTVAMNACCDAERVYCGALLNGRALVDRISGEDADRGVLLVCSGSAGNFNLEDFYGAGYLVELLAQKLGERADFSDAARAARALYRHAGPFESLINCRVGRMMAERGLAEEVRYVSQLSRIDVVPTFADGVLTIRS